MSPLSFVKNPFVRAGKKYAFSTRNNREKRMMTRFARSCDNREWLVIALRSSGKVGHENVKDPFQDFGKDCGTKKRSLEGYFNQSWKLCVRKSAHICACDL